jgi:hypothetical protein
MRLAINLLFLEIDMKLLASALILSASAFASVTAHAAEASGELDYPPALSTTSHVSRADVLAELRRAEAAGTISRGDLDYPPVQAPASTLSRADVRAELARANAAGEIQRGDATFLPADASMG